jgi:hypothetical protein
MPINTDLNVSPYYDDFDANNQYYRILFRPSVPVQARELSQVQSILQHQIESFANWAFKNGDIVPNSGCAITDQPKVDFVRLSDYQANGFGYNALTLANLMVYSTTSNLHASVLYSSFGLEKNYPNTKVVYVNYENTGDNGEKLFSSGETLTFYYRNDQANVAAVVNAFSNSTGQNTTGFGHGITVSDGVVYLNGTFVQVLNRTWGLVKPFDTYAGNNIVGFQAVESIIDDTQDSALLDNALGYSNENAPGAHRLKIQPILTSLDPTTAAGTKDFVPIAVYQYGKLLTTQKSTDPFLAIKDILAKRTYEEAGNFVVKPFTMESVTVTGSPEIDAALTGNAFNVRISSGSGYAQGYEVSRDNTSYVQMRRGTDTKTVLNQSISFNYGNYYVVNELAGSFDFDKAQSVDLYDTPIKAVTTRAFNNLTASGSGSNTITNGSISSNKIGTALVKCFSYDSGMLGANTTQYILHVFNVQMKSGYNTNQVAAIFNNSGSVKGVADVAVPGIQKSSMRDQLYSFGVNGVKNLRDDANNINTEYTYRKKSSTTIDSYGQATVTLTTSSAGGTDILPYPVSVLTDTAAASFIMVVKQTTNSTSLGTCQVSSTNTDVTVTDSSKFKDNFRVGDLIKVGSNFRTITAIANNRFLSVDAVWPSTTSGSYYKMFQAGKVLPITQTFGGPISYVDVSNTTSFTVYTTEQPGAAGINVEIVYDVLRKHTSPASKVIKKDRFVKINITADNRKGPWCLGVSDIHRVKGIYGNLNGTYTMDNDITNYFTYDTGQKDTHYDLGYLYPKAGFSDSIANNILVHLDYFTTNVTGGVGFYTIESYPINDGEPGSVNAVSTGITGNGTSFNTSFIVGDIVQIGNELRTISNIANSTYMTVNSDFINSYVNASYFKYDTIQTKDVPLYVDESGKKIPLRDYVDFRPVATQTAIDTGFCDMTNGSQITTAIASASVNPSSTLSISAPGTGLNIPSYGKTLNSDYIYYLPRKDLVMIAADPNGLSDGVIKIKEGLPAINPQTPLYPDNAMVMSVVNIPPYPSLTSDQLDDFLAINKLSKSLIRDTSPSISSQIVSNRRYTMKDVGVLDNRITNLEYYQALSLLEKKAADMTVTDSNGLNRYKNGIFVENFNDFTKSDVSNHEFSLAIDATKARARPRITREIIDIEFTSTLSTNTVKTGRLVTLPYTETVFLSQPYATKYRSSAHVSLAWNGTCVLIPSYDNHNDYNNTGSISLNIDNATPWNQFAKSPFGSVWGDWKTTSSITTSTTNVGGVHGDGKQVNVDLGFIGGYIGASQQWADQAAVSKIQAMYGDQVQIAGLSVIHTGTYSDIRLKKNISRIGKLLNGLNLYRYRYLWSETFYVGVMAQEVEKIIPDAVVYDGNGYMKVNYAKVGIPFLTWGQWLTTNNSAV